MYSICASECACEKLVNLKRQIVLFSTVSYKIISYAQFREDVYPSAVVPKSKCQINLPGWNAEIMHTNIQWKQDWHLISGWKWFWQFSQYIKILRLWWMSKCMKFSIGFKFFISPSIAKRLRIWKAMFHWEIYHFSKVGILVIYPKSIIQMHSYLFLFLDLVETSLYREY